MKQSSGRSWVVVVTVALMASAASAGATLTPDNLCQLAKVKAANKQFSAYLACRSKGLRLELAGKLFDKDACYAAARTKLIDTFARIDLRYPTCPTAGNGPTVAFEVEGRAADTWDGV